MSDETGTWLDHEAALSELLARYPHDRTWANGILHKTRAKGSYDLARHTIRFRGWQQGGETIGLFQVVPQPWTGDGSTATQNARPPLASSCEHEPEGREIALAPEPPPDGHELARQLIAKHGTDRYPTPAAQFSKLLDETGELAEALMDRHAVQHVPHDGGTAEGCPGCFGTDALDAHVAKELADVGLCLYELATKLGYDLLGVMEEVVRGETRRFAVKDPACPDCGQSAQHARGNADTGIFGFTCPAGHSWSKTTWGGKLP